MKDDSVKKSRACRMAWVNLTYDCDLACRWCYAESARSSYFMSSETLDKISILLNDLGIDSMLLSGGEPLLHPDCLRIIKKFQDDGFTVALNTNGLAFADRKVLDQAIGNGRLLICFSLKAVNAEDFRRNTGVDDFDRQKQAVANIVARGHLGFNATIILTRYFIKKFDEAVALLDSWGVENVHIDLAKPTIRGELVPTVDEASAFVAARVISSSARDAEPCSKSQEEIVEFIASGKTLSSVRGPGFVLRYDLPLCLLQGRGIDMELAQPNFLTNCFLRDGNGLVFNPQGGLIPCNHLTDTVLGQIGVDFSTAEDYRAFLRRDDVARTLRALQGESDPECEECGLASRCCHGCAVFGLDQGPRKPFPLRSQIGS